MLHHIVNLAFKGSVSIACLFSAASSSFLSPNHHQSGDEDEDGDYVPPTADDWKKLPRVGEKYQVV